MNSKTYETKNFETWIRYKSGYGAINVEKDHVELIGSVNLAAPHTSQGDVITADNLFTYGTYSVEINNHVGERNGFWFFSEKRHRQDNVLPEIEVCRFSNKEISSGINFGKNFSDQYFENHKKHRKLFLPLKKGWNTYTMKWGENIKIYFNDKLVQKIQNTSSKNLIPVISCNKGTILAKNFRYYDGF